jgi:hypothetical protein
LTAYVEVRKQDGPQAPYVLHIGHYSTEELLNEAMKFFKTQGATNFSTTYWSVN